MNQLIYQTSKQIIDSALLDHIVRDSEFRFEKLIDVFQLFEDYNIEGIKKSLIEIFDRVNNNDSYFKFETLLGEAKKTIELYDFLLLIGKIISYCDEKAYHKKVWNEYPDYRVLAKAQVTMKRWMLGFLKHKLGNAVEYQIESMVKKTIDFIKDPRNQVNSFSDTHRALISEKILEQSYQPDIFCETLIKEFSPLFQNISNQKNNGVLIAALLYHPEIKKIWKDSIDGLVAQDSTDWFDSAITESKGHNHYIVWNDKKPIGSEQTLKLLKETLDDGGFYIFFFKEASASYRAHVKDFAESQMAYSKKFWKELNPYGYEDSFSEYTDGSKWASIVFLCDELMELQCTLPAGCFRLRGSDSLPFNGNMRAFNFSEKAEHVIQISNATKIPIIMPSLNTILYGPPGTGKTYNTITKAIEIITGENFSNNYSEAQALYKQRQAEDQIEFVTFHQNYSYEDFVAGLRPNTENSELSFKEHKGVFYRISKKAEENWKDFRQYEKGEKFKVPGFDEILNEFLKPLAERDEPIVLQTLARNVNFQLYSINEKNFGLEKSSGSKEHTISMSTLKALYEGRREYNLQGLGVYYYPILERLKEIAITLKREITEVKLRQYVLIIDEINRANISRVFGELITLLEPDKRLGEKHELTLRLPGLPDDERFGVPPNLYIVATMNTADKSIALIDIALRRRFVFEDMYPRPDVINTTVPEAYRAFLIALNNLIKEKKGVDFTIGHAYFIPDEEKPFDIVQIFNQKVIPLLNEYFYNQRNNPVWSLLSPLQSLIPGVIFEQDEFIGIKAKIVV